MRRSHPLLLMKCSCRVKIAASALVLIAIAAVTGWFVFAHQKPPRFIRLREDRVSYLMRVDGNHSEDGFLHFYRMFRGQFWEPTLAQAREADHAIEVFFQQSKNNLRLAFPDLPDDHPRAKRLKREITEIADHDTKYGRQFFGANYNGEKYICGNYFYLDENGIVNKEYAQRHFVEVMDGGSHYWFILYSPQTKRCSNLRFNGSADPYDD